MKFSRSFCEKKSSIAEKSEIFLIFIGHSERGGGPIRSEIEIVQGINIEKR